VVDEFEFEERPVDALTNDGDSLVEPLRQSVFQDRE